MSMGIGTNTQNPDEGELKRDLEKIACGVWFTSTGSVMPKLVKYQDDEGLLHTISQIHVLTQEKKYYCGIPIQEYRYSSGKSRVSIPALLLSGRKLLEDQLGRNISLQAKGEKTDVWTILCG